MKTHSNDGELFDELSKFYEEISGQKLPGEGHYKRGDEIFRQGQHPKGVYFIKSGSVKITRNNHEAPVTVRLAGDGEFIGYISLIKQWDYQSSALALEPSVVYFIPGDIFLENMKTNVKFANLVLDIICSHINDRDETLTDMVTKSVQQRLAILLLTLDHNPNDGKIALVKRDLASILNIKPETLSRNLVKLEKLNAVKLYQVTNEIEILSREKLLELSEVTD